jgi:hypothetical protein
MEDEVLHLRAETAELKENREGVGVMERECDSQTEFKK